MKDRIVLGSVTTPKGFQAAGVRCGLKEKGTDLALIFSTTPAAAAALFTTNKIQAAPVQWSKKQIMSGHSRAIIINSGNANACTGLQGDQDAEEMAALTASALSIHKEEVLTASTGIIGKPLAMDKIRPAISQAVAALSTEGGEQAARAIMTTDLAEKHFAVEIDIQGRPVRIGAMAKGSGMINPNLATMICCVTTDAAITPPMLDRSLRLATADSLNCLTVDGEMSTNDCVFILANAQSGNSLIDAPDEDFDKFSQALSAILETIARAIAMDGEGATKLLRVQIHEARNPEQARQAAKAVANSLLVKTAIFGQDPNWGRVVSAVGGSGVDLLPEKMAVSFAGIQVLHNGQPIVYDKAAMKEALQQKEIVIEMSLAAGSASGQVFSCDLSYDYVKINAEYHT